MTQNERFSDKELTEKLLHVSDEEMKLFHNKRMKKYKNLYILAGILAIFSTIIYFILSNFRLFAICLAIVGIIIIAYSGYNREKWKKLFHKMVYLKKNREKKILDLDKKKNPYKNKYQQK